MTFVSDAMQSSDIKELASALIQAQKELTGICLTNSDAKADWAAVTEKNHKILSKYNLVMTELIDKDENGSITIITILCHSKSGQYQKSESTLENKKNCSPLEFNSPDVFLMRRFLYEALLGIASANDALEAELFGPKRRYRELPPLYDKTAKFIPFDYINQDGEVFEKKIDRKKFEKVFLGMTSEEEEEATEFKVSEFREFSWSNIKLFLQCKRCFYNAKKFYIKPPTFDSEGFALPKAVDTLLKKEFDQYREIGKTHPIMADINAIKPLRHKKLKKWQTAWIQQERKSGGIQFKDVWCNWRAYGGVDDIWINEKKELVIVEYKTVAQEKVNSSGSNVRYLEVSQKQIDFYAWLFRKNNYAVCSIGYLLFYNALTNKNTFDSKLEFKPHLVPHKIDDSWVQSTIDDALRCLDKKMPPPCAANCRTCKYFNSLTAKEKRDKSTTT